MSDTKEMIALLRGSGWTNSTNAANLIEVQAADLLLARDAVGLLSNQLAIASQRILELEAGIRALIVANDATLGWYDEVERDHEWIVSRDAMLAILGKATP